MPTSRRRFLQTTIIAGAGSTLPALPAFAAGARGAAPEAAAPTGAQTSAQAAEAFTRGIGVYPGAPGEYFCPTAVIDTTTYRNLALRRPASHSSAYDYNTTAQLVTDGIKQTTLPRWVAASTSTLGTLAKPDREVFLDHWEANMTEIKGSHGTAELEIGGGTEAPEIDRVRVFLAVPAHIAPASITLNINTSEDAATWTLAGSLQNPPLVANAEVTYPPDIRRGNNLFFPSIPLKAPVRSRFYQLELVLNGAPAEDTTPWRLGQIEFFRGEDREEIGGPYSFTSAWRSAGLGEEWVAVDLGAPCTFDRITLSWIARAAEGSIQTSNDGETWQTLRPLPADDGKAGGNTDDLHLAPPVEARHVRVLMTRPASPDGYILSELEVFGRGGPIPQPVPAQQPTPDGRLDLAGGRWRLERDSQVEAPGAALSKPGFNDESWLPATVPGTTLTSYLNAGAIPDPNYGQNQLYISDSYFYADFWYRTVFTPPPARPGQLQWLHFDGINWKAEVFFNGESLGHIDGGFLRGRFDITAKVKPGAENVLAVRVLKNATPGSCKQKTYESPGPNGGAPGADNATMHASIGWDWIPTIRGRNTGIWGDVFITTTGAVTVDDPLVTSIVPDASRADVTLSVNLENHSAQPVSGTLRGSLGTHTFAQKITLAASARQNVAIAPIRLDHPELWWPVGYGEPKLHDAELSFETTNGQRSDRRTFKAGIRQMTATETGGNLRLFINGRRFIARGGNWGFAESMLRYRGREYDASIRYHREMNFTMIRNWVGQIPDDAFYEACDRHGIVVWQDFWLANPWDGPIPNDNELFLANARDLVRRIRSHASIGLYCGRNEGFPPPVLEAGIRKLLGELHPDIHYIGSSADGVVSGHGPYRALPTITYFKHADPQLHSEIGMPNIPSIESVRLMMPERALWPQALDWGLHDFSYTGAQGAATFIATIANDYGGAHTAEEWIALAQFVNYEGYRAIFEAGSKYRMGILLWMSHPCWPSFVWQTYDFYLEPTAAYFACKKASEPLHIQWNRLTGFVEVVNLSAGQQDGLTAKLELFNLDGTRQATAQASLDSPEDSVNPCLKIAYPEAALSPVHLLRLTLTRGDQVLSSNIYLRGKQEGNYRAIRDLAKAQVTASTTATRAGDVWHLATDLHNPGTIPALMIRLKAVREIAGDRILPVLYEDNYVTLMPGERRTIKTELRHADTRGQSPKINVSGFNL